MDPITTFVADVEAAAVKYRQAVTPIPPSPPPPPPPSPPIPPVTNDLPKVATSTRKVGGWKLVADYCGSGMAYDPKTRTLAIAGKESVDRDPNTGKPVGQILLFDVPEPGSGTDPNTFPILRPKESIPYWWWDGIDYGPGVDPENPPFGALFPSGLAFIDGDLWCVWKEYYSQNPYANLTAASRSGKVRQLPGFLQQVYGGYIKLFGAPPLLGCGTPASSKNATIGPTACDWSGKVILDSPVFDCPADQRPLRDPDYQVDPNQKPKDQWLAYPPFVDAVGPDGYRYGYFTGGTRIYGGGLVVNGELRFWPIMGTGVISYGNQGDGVNVTFAQSAVTPEYRYPVGPDGTASRKNYKWYQTDFRGSTAPEDTCGAIKGQDFYDDGRLLILEGGAWARNTDNYPASKTSPVLWLCEP